MGIEYYSVLKVGKSASDEEVKNAYRKLAMKWHPHNHPKSKQMAEAKFREISEAYQVLIDPQMRAIYKESGDEGLKGQSAEERIFRPKSPEEVFEEVFGFSSPACSTGKSTEALFGNGDLTNMERVLKSALNKSGPLVKAAPLEKKLLCTLEELHSGCTRKIKISRNIIDSNGRVVPMEEMLTVEVKPGWKKGTRITFLEKGNQKPDTIAADLVFVIDEKAHQIFRREEDDLVVVHRVLLADALTGCAATINTLDGRVLNIPCAEVIYPGYEKVVAGEGMPIPKQPGKKGNLRIQFDIRFPQRLSVEQKAIIRKAL